MQQTIIQPKEELSYQTTDSCLAAYLHSQGFNFIKAISTEFPSIFLFENNKDIKEKAQLLQKGEAIGNIQAYQRSYKFILSQIDHKNKR
jgi:hypothetical protein